MHQYLQFNSCLVLEPFLISDQLNCNQFFGFVIKAFQGLAEASFTQEFNYLKSESYVILHDNLIVASLIVKTKVVGVKRRTLNFVRANTKIVYLLIIKDFTFLMIS